MTNRDALEHNRDLIIGYLYSNFDYNKYYDLINSSSWDGYIAQDRHDIIRIINELYDSIISNRLFAQNGSSSSTGGFVLGLDFDGCIFLYFDVYYNHKSGYLYVNEISKNTQVCSYINTDILSFIRKLKINKIKNETVFTNKLQIQ